MALMAILSFWALAWALSIPAFNPEGQAGGRAFAGWQGIAGMLALAAHGLGRNWPEGAGIRKLAAVPLVTATLVGFGVIVALSGIGRIG